MHSRIIELTLEPLDREDWAGEDCFYDDGKVDYVSELDDDERRERVLRISKMTKILSLVGCLLLGMRILSFSREKMLS